jgi:hypothetical protein
MHFIVFLKLQLSAPTLRIIYIISIILCVHALQLYTAITCYNTHSWEEFAELFKLIGDSEYAAGQLMKAELRGLVQVALLKLTMGSQPDPAEHLAAFLGMPSNCRRVSR